MYSAGMWVSQSSQAHNGLDADISIWPFRVYSYMELVQSIDQCLEVSDIDAGGLKIRVRGLGADVMCCWLRRNNHH